MSWWCSATGQAWDWTWRAYPGVWLFVLALGAAYWRVIRQGTPRERRRGLAFGAAGLGLTWLMLDWPVGPLGAGYLVSVHAAQFLALAFIVPPLLLAGVPAAAWTRLESAAAGHAVTRFLAHPVLAGAAFNLIVLTTHLPSVVDGLMVTQLGAFAIDLLWLGGGLAFWRPIISPAWRAGGLAKLLYLFFGTLVHTALGMWLLLSRLPVYGAYELAPPIGGRSAMVDQGIAGGIMELIGGIIVIGSMAIIFFRWAAREGKPSHSPVDLA